MTHRAARSAIMANVSTATAAPRTSPHVSVNRPNPVSVGTIVWLVRGAAVAVDTLAIMAEPTPSWAIGASGRRRVNVTP